VHPSITKNAKMSGPLDGKAWRFADTLFLDSAQKVGSKLGDEFGTNNIMHI
jgi:hypothetical protein